MKTSQLEQFFMFSISSLPPESAFQMFTHFQHPWPLGQKSVIQIFERWSGCKIIMQNVSGGYDFKWFQHHVQRVSLSAVTLLVKGAQLINMIYGYNTWPLSFDTCVFCLHIGIYWTHQVSNARDHVSYRIRIRIRMVYSAIVRYK